MHPKPKPLSEAPWSLQQNHKLLPIIDHLVVHNLHILKLGSKTRAHFFSQKKATQMTMTQPLHLKVIFSVHRSFAMPTAKSMAEGRRPGAGVAQGAREMLRMRGAGQSCCTHSPPILGVAIEDHHIAAHACFLCCLQHILSKCVLQLRQEKGHHVFQRLQKVHLRQVQICPQCPCEKAPCKPTLADEQT